MNRSDRPAEHVRDYDRRMLRSAVVSLFWSVISERRRGGFKLQALADALGRDKSAVSRWFSGSPPNWTIDTISDIAHALDLDVQVTVRDRSTGRVHAASGPLQGKGETAPHAHDEKAVAVKV